jgi:flagellar biosynthetic protein FliP
VRMAKLLWGPGSFGLAVLLASALLPQLSYAEGIPALRILEGNDGGTEYSLSLQLIIVMTLLGLLPSILILMTSFTRIIIVLSLLRQAMGTAQTPPNQVLIGIALFLTLFIMNPILQAIYDDARSKKDWIGQRFPCSNSCWVKPGKKT